MNELTSQEESRLHGLELIISNGEQIFLLVANAFLEIRQKRLYRRGYKTFKQYMEQKWGKSARWAQLMIKSGAVVQSLPEEMRTLVRTEGVARAIGNVPQEKRVQVVEAAAKNGHVTAKAVAQAAKTVTKPAKVVHEDKMGTIIPDEIVHIWERRGEVRELMAEASQLKCKLEKLRGSGDVLFQKIGQNAVVKMLTVHQELANAYPEIVCGSCEGRNSSKCGACDGTGFQSEQHYNRITPIEDRKIRELAIAERKNASPRLPTTVSRLHP